jgi:hypothetical protein
MSAGRHPLTWDRRDASGRSVAAGVYVVRLTAGAEQAAARVVLAD